MPTTSLTHLAVLHPIERESLRLCPCSRHECCSEGVPCAAGDCSARVQAEHCCGTHTPQHQCCGRAVCVDNSCVSIGSGAAHRTNHRVCRGSPEVRGGDGFCGRILHLVSWRVVAVRLGVHQLPLCVLSPCVWSVYTRVAMPNQTKPAITAHVGTAGTQRRCSETWTRSPSPLT